MQLLLYFDFVLELRILLHLTLPLIPTPKFEITAVPKQRAYQLQISLMGFTIYVCYQNDRHSLWSGDQSY